MRPASAAADSARSRRSPSTARERALRRCCAFLRGAFSRPSCSTIRCASGTSARDARCSRSSTACRDGARAATTICCGRSMSWPRRFAAGSKARRSPRARRGRRPPRRMRASARFGEFDDLHLVGLVEGEWPDARAETSSTRPAAADAPRLARRPATRSAAERAAFVDLLRLASRARLALGLPARRRRARRTLAAAGRRAARRSASLPLPRAGGGGLRARGAGAPARCRRSRPRESRRPGWLREHAPGFSSAGVPRPLACRPPRAPGRSARSSSTPSARSSTTRAMC